MGRHRHSRRAAVLSAALVLCAAWTAGAVERETSYVYPPFKHTLGMHRVGEMELKLFLGPTARLDNPQGIDAIKLADRDDPKTHRDDDELSLFMVNSGRGEIFYNPSQTALRRFGERGRGEGRFLDPRGIAVNADGVVAVADTGNRRVVLLRLGAKELEWTGEIDGVDGPISPTDVAFADGLLWVTDFAAGRILRFKPDGSFVDTWAAGRMDSLEGPLALAVQGAKDKWNQVRRFSLLVVDRGGRRVQLFGERGVARAAAEVDSLVAGPARLGYPVIDLHGQVLLPDSLGGRLLKLDQELRPLRVLDHIDDDERPLDHPNSLALYRRFGQLFIVESRGGSYVWTGTGLGQVRLRAETRASRRGLQLEFTLWEPSLVSVHLVGAAGERELMPSRRRQAGPRREWLDLEHVSPAELARSRLLLRVTPTYSAKKHLTVERQLQFPDALRARRSEEPDGGP